MGRVEEEAAKLRAIKEAQARADKKRAEFEEVKLKAEKEKRQAMEAKSLAEKKAAEAAKAEATAKAASHAVRAKAEAEAALIKATAQKQAADKLAKARKDAEKATAIKAISLKPLKPKVKVTPRVVIAKPPVQKAKKPAVVAVPIDHPVTFSPHVRLGKFILKTILNIARNTRDFNVDRFETYAAQTLYFLLVYYRFPGFIISQ